MCFFVRFGYALGSINVAVVFVSRDVAYGSRCFDVCGAVLGIYVAVCAALFLWVF